MEQASFSFDLSDEEQAVYSLLRTGRSRALSAQMLADETGLTNQQVRATVRRLIMVRGMLIASVVDDPPGFYIAETREEIITATRSLRHRGIMILVRAARLQKSSLELVFKLGRLEFEEEGKNEAI